MRKKRVEKRTDKRANYALVAFLALIVVLIAGNFIPDLRYAQKPSIVKEGGGSGGGDLKEYKYTISLQNNYNINSNTTLDAVVISTDAPYGLSLPLYSNPDYFFYKSHKLVIGRPSNLNNFWGPIYYEDDLGNLQLALGVWQSVMIDIPDNKGRAWISHFPGAGIIALRGDNDGYISSAPSLLQYDDIHLQIIAPGEDITGFMDFGYYPNQTQLETFDAYIASNDPYLREYVGDLPVDLDLAYGAKIYNPLEGFYNDEFVISFTK